MWPQSNEEVHMKHSKQLAAIVAKNPKYLSEYYCDADGHWMHTTTGFIFPDMECGTLHEQTVGDMLAHLKGGVEEAQVVGGFSVPQQPRGRIVKVLK
jgi:hypothetical protein